MNRWRTRTAALLLAAPLALTAACSDDSGGEAEVDVNTPEVDAPEVPDVDAPDVDVETEG